MVWQMDVWMRFRDNRRRNCGWNPNILGTVCELTSSSSLTILFYWLPCKHSKVKARSDVCAMIHVRNLILISGHTKQMIVFSLKFTLLVVFVFFKTVQRRLWGLSFFLFFSLFVCLFVTKKWSLLSNLRIYVFSFPEAFPSQYFCLKLSKREKKVFPRNQKFA